MLSYDRNLAFRIAFASVKGMTVTFASEMLSRLGNEELFFTATTSQLKALLGFDNAILDAAYRKEILEKGKREAEYIEANNIGVLYFDSDAGYPNRLRECDDAPALLYALGACDLNSAHIISVVGTRHATVYGMGFVKELVEQLGNSLSSTVVVSGLAYGIDVTAHKESMRNGVPTVGVLAHGLSTIYPAAHRNIAAAMVKGNGMLLTDYMHDARMHRSNFLARNRIVAGLADCILVAESAVKGGAMVTADIGCAYNRDVFAVPGRVGDTYSGGCNRLIADNKASLVTSPDDIMEFMGWKSTAPAVEARIFPVLTSEEQAIYDFLERNGEGFINRISVETALPIHRLMGILVDMEFRGIIVNMPGGNYRLK